MSYVPTTCDHCHTPLPAEPAPGDPEPSWHQAAEIPDLVVRDHRVSRTRADLPRLWPPQSSAIPPEIQAHVLGPRLAAVMSYFSGRHHLGRRAVEEVVETVFEVPTSLASVFSSRSRDECRLGLSVSRG